MPSPTSSTRPTSLVSICPRKSSISFWRTEAISSALNFMETPLAQAGPQLFHAGPQRAVVNRIADLDHHSAQHRRVGLVLENGFKRKHLGQPPPDLCQRFLRKGRRTQHPHAPLPLAQLVLQPRFLEDHWQQFQPVVLRQHAEKAREQVRSAT